MRDDGVAEEREDRVGADARPRAAARRGAGSHAERGAARSGPLKRLNSSSAGRIASTASDSPSVVAASGGRWALSVVSRIAARMRTTTRPGGPSWATAMAATVPRHEIDAVRGPDARSRRARVAPRLDAARAVLRPRHRGRGRGCGRRPSTTASRTTTSRESILSYAMTFFAIWWAWMSFSWFATAYDTDDVPVPARGLRGDGGRGHHRGRHRAMPSARATGRVVTLGYVVMRLAAVTQWARAARSDPSHRANSHPLGHRHQRRPGRLGAAAVRPVDRRPASSGFGRPRPRRARGPDLGGESDAAALALGAHRRALRAVHDHRARRVGARRDARDHGGDRRRRDGREPRRRRRRRAARRVRDVVAVLRATDRRPAHDASVAASSGATATTSSGPRPPPSGLASRSRSTSRPTTPRSDACRAGFSLAVPVAVYVVGTWVLHDVPRPMPTWRMALSPIAALLVLVAPLHAGASARHRAHPDRPPGGTDRHPAPGDRRRGRR